MLRTVRLQRRIQRGIGALWASVGIFNTETAREDLYHNYLQINMLNLRVTPLRNNWLSNYRKTLRFYGELGIWKATRTCDTSHCRTVCCDTLALPQPQGGIDIA